MHNFIIKLNQSIIFLLLSLSIINSYSARAEPRLKIKGINIGVYEKGPYFGIFTDLGEKNQLELGLNYLDIPLGKYDVGFSNDIQTNLSFTGLKFLFRRYLKTTEKNGIYAQFGLEANYMAATSKIELSEMTYKTNNISILCPSCDSMDLSIKPKIFPFIPSLSLGWQSKISSRVNFQTSLGVQYKKIDNASWKYNSDRNLPFFVRDEINSAMNEVNNFLNNLPTIYPTLTISISYLI